MSLSLTTESKNSLSLTGEEKGKDITWDEATFTFDDAGGQTWDSNGYLILASESKNSLSLTNETKS